MKQIQPITIWSNGQQLTATVISMSSVADDLVANATFYYELLSPSKIDEDGNVLGYNRIVQGYLNISDSEYDAWGDAANINEAAYVWGAQQLNLTLV